MRVYKEIAQKYLPPQLKPWREARAMTQEEAAELLQIVQGKGAGWWRKIRSHPAPDPHTPGSQLSL